MRTMIILFVVFLLSCGNSSELEKLREENKKLMEIIVKHNLDGELKKEVEVEENKNTLGTIRVKFLGFKTEYSMTHFYLN